MALMQVTVIPMGTESVGVSDFVADFKRHLEQKNIHHAMNDMATVIHGETEELLRIAAELHNMPFAKGAPRVITQISIDERQDKEVGLGDKLRAVEEKL